MNFVIDDTDIVIRIAIVDDYTCIHVIDVCAFKVEYTKLYYKTFMYKQALGWGGEGGEGCTHNAEDDK